MATKSKLIYSISPRKVKAVENFDVKDRAMLSQIGVNLSDAQAKEMFGQMRGSFAMDEAITGPQGTTASIATPIRFLQTILPGFVNTLTAARKIDTLVGVATVGAWEDEEVVQGFAEHTGRALPYTDASNYALADWNVNFARRTVISFEEGLTVTKRQEARAARMNFNSAQAKRIACQDALEIERNKVGFFGYNAPEVFTYGFLNDPNLPAYQNVPAGDAGDTKWEAKTAQEIIADLKLAIAALRKQSGDNIDPREIDVTLALGTGVVDYLSSITDIGYTVTEWLEKNYHRVRIVSAPQLDEANGGATVGYLYAEEVADNSTDNRRTFDQLVPTKSILLGTQMTAKGYEEDYSNATAGVLCKRPFAVYRFSGI